MTNAATETPDGKPGMGDLAEIFYAPSAVFTRRTGGEWGMPYIALVVVGLVLFFATKNLIMPVIDAAIDQGFAAAAAKQPDRAAQIQQTAPMAKSVTHIIFMAYYVIAPFIVGLCVWIGGKLAKVQNIGAIAMMVAVFSFFPKLLGTVVGAIFAALAPEGAATAASISLSPARLMSATTSPALMGLLARFDLFLLWSIVLIAIGVQVAGRATKAQAWTTAGTVWVITALPAIWALIRS